MGFVSVVEDTDIDCTHILEEDVAVPEHELSLYSSVAEGESATFGYLSLANAGIAKCVDQIYPLLYPQIA